MVRCTSICIIKGKRKLPENALIDFTNFFIYRPVSKTDIANTEKRILQTIDMIINKKKRIALAKHKSSSYLLNTGQSKPGLWGFFKSVSSSVTGSGESILCI